MKNPLVSVIIPTLPDRKELLDRALKSVKNQTYDNIEIIVEQEGNSASIARNVGASKAKGKYLAFLDDDDEWLLDKTEKQVAVMETYQSCPLVISWSEDRRFDRTRLSKPKKVSTQQDIKDAFNYSSTSSYMVRKSFFDKVGAFDTTLASAHEYDLAIRLTQYGDAICVQKVLMVQHSTEGQISTNWKGKIKGIKALRKKGYWKGKNKIKSYGLCALYRLGYVFGNRIYFVGDYMRGRHE